MEFKEVMQLLADNYVVGISVACAIVIITYVIVSILIVRFCRSENINVGVSGMLPIVQLIMLLRGKLTRRRRIKNESVLDADAEIDLSF